MATYASPSAATQVAGLDGACTSGRVHGKPNLKIVPVVNEGKLLSDQPVQPRSMFEATETTAFNRLPGTRADSETVHFLR